MAKVEIKLDMNKVKKYMDRKIQKAMTIVGAVGIDVVSEQLRKNKSVVTGNLLNSITYSISSKANMPKTGSELVKPEEKNILRIGTTVVYAPRVEFGFDGADSLGRIYSQPEKSFLRAGLFANQEKLSKIFSFAMKTY